MGEVTDLAQAKDQSLQIVNDLLSAPEPFDAKMKQLFLHLKLLMQCCRHLHCQLEVNVPQYCSTCGKDSAPNAEWKLPCGNECYTCGFQCFINKYGDDFNPDRRCEVCGQVFLREKWEELAGGGR